MPPKKRIDQQQVLEVAFNILREEGYAAISTRRLASELGCSTQPLYGLFQNMDELKKILYKKCCIYFKQCVYEHVKGEEEIFLEIGLGYILSAQKEDHIFRFITATKNYSLVSIKDLVKGFQKDKDLSPQGEERFLNMWLYVHGIASIISGNKVESDEEEYRQMLINAYKHFSREV